MTDLIILVLVVVPAILAWDGWRRWLATKPNTDRIDRLEQGVKILQEQVRVLSTPQPFRASMGHMG